MKKDERQENAKRAAHPPIERRRLCCALLWALPLAASCALGRRLVRDGTVFGGMEFLAGDLFWFLLLGAILSFGCAFFLGSLGESAPRRGRAQGGRADDLTDGKAAGGCGRAVSSAGEEAAGAGARAAGGVRPVWQVRLFYVCALVFAWFPVFLAYYPSVFAYDAEGQLYQVLAGDYSTHHPLLHTLFLGAFFRLGGTLGSYPVGMALHSLAQMLLLAAAFAYALGFLYERGVSVWLRFALFLFYALHPANAVLSVSVTKDVLFSALVLVYTVSLFRLALSGGWPGEKGTAGKRARCVLWGALMLLFRNNAVHAFVLSVPAICALEKWAGIRRSGRIETKPEAREKADEGRTETEPEAGEKAAENSAADRAFRDKENVFLKKRGGWLRMAFLILALYATASFALQALTHARSGSPRELLSVPLQQMARVRVEAEQELSPQLRQKLDKYIPAAWVFAAYNPHLADPVKNRALIRDDPAGLLKTWLVLGLRHPGIYVDAFLDNVLGLWYLGDVSHAQVYGVGAETGFGYLSTDTRTMPPGFEVEQDSALPGLRAFLERIVSDNAYQRLPLVPLLFSPALFWWLLWLYLVAALYWGKRRELIPAAFLAAYWLTLLLSPTVLVRYAYPLMVAVPVLLACQMGGGVAREWENTQ